MQTVVSVSGVVVVEWMIRFLGWRRRGRRSEQGSDSLITETSPSRYQRQVKDTGRVTVHESSATDNGSHHLAIGMQILSSWGRRFHLPQSPHPPAHDIGHNAKGGPRFDGQAERTRAKPAHAVELAAEKWTDGRAQLVLSERRMGHVSAICWPLCLSGNTSG
ncbi:hypothetical protein VTI74DRAFT_7609 [Chaetomium olivicolor]